jgi:hypothetical protein
MSNREIREALAAGVTGAAVEAFLNDLAVRETEGETLEAEELRRKEAILDLAQKLGISDEGAKALWTVAEEKLL